MEESRTKNVLKGVTTGTINKVVMLFFPLIIRLVMIKTIGIDYLGLNSLFSSILGVLSISELGFSSAIIYSMYKPLAEKNITKVNALLKFYRKVYRIIGSIIAVIGIFLVPFLDYFIAEESVSNINITILYFIYLFNSVISYFLFSYKSSLLNAMQRTNVVNSIGTLICIGQNIIQLFILIFIKDYYCYVLILPICTIINNYVCSHYVDKHFPEYECKGELDKSEVKDLFKKVGALIGNRINGTLILSADNLVISAFLGITVVAIYNNYYTIISALVSFVVIIFNALRPSIGNSLVLESKSKNYKDYETLSMIMAWISGWCSICLLCLFQPFVSLYYGSEYLLPMSTVVLFASYFYEWKMIDVQVLYRDAAGLWWSDRYRPYIVCILNLILNIVLVKIIGLNGVVISTMATQLFISFPWLIVALHKECFEKKPWKYVIKLLYYTFVIVLAAFITYYICGIINFSNNIINLIISAFICCLFPNIIILIGFFKCDEFKKIVELLKRIVIPRIRKLI